MPTCYQLIGVPGAGKSTWYSQQDWMSEMAYISTDKYVEEYAIEQGKSYSDVFEEFMPEAVKLMVLDVNKAAIEGKDIVWDQTSTTVSSRKRKFGMLPFYEHIAVIFPTPELKELENRLQSRKEKVIPREVVWNMIVNFEEPSEEEGFKEIWKT
jgi:predicted kinase